MREEGLDPPSPLSNSQINQHMENTKITAQTLETAGFTETQIDRYYKILDLKKYYGFDALTVSDRQFLRSARVAVEKVATAHKAALVAGRKNRLSGKTPVETKKHYRWAAAELSVVNSLTDLAVDEVSCFAIVKQEILRALSLYQPVLDQVDTVHRFKFIQPELDLIQLGLTYSGSRIVQFDTVAAKNQLRLEFSEDWNSKWDNYFGEMPMVAIPMSDEIDYTRVVRPEIERLTREIYPSVVVTV